MIKKPVTFTPTLFEAQGINNYSGKLFKCFTKGNTLPFRFTFKNKSTGEVLDVTGYQVWVMLSNTQAVNGGDSQTQILIEKQIPLVNLVEGIFEGDISDTETNSLPAGLIYAQAKYVDNLGRSFTIDMAIVEAYPAVPYTTL